MSVLRKAACMIAASMMAVPASVMRVNAKFLSSSSLSEEQYSDLMDKINAVVYEESPEKFSLSVEQAAELTETNPYFGEILNRKFNALHKGKEIRLVDASTNLSATSKEVLEQCAKRQNKHFELVFIGNKVSEATVEKVKSVLGDNYSLLLTCKWCAVPVDFSKSERVWFVVGENGNLYNYYAVYGDPGQCGGCLEPYIDQDMLKFILTTPAAHVIEHNVSGDTDKLAKSDNTKQNNSQMISENFDSFMISFKTGFAKGFFWGAVLAPVIMVSAVV